MGRPPCVERLAATARVSSSGGAGAGSLLYRRPPPEGSFGPCQLHLSPCSAFFQLAFGPRGGRPPGSPLPPRQAAAAQPTPAPVSLGRTEAAAARALRVTAEPAGLGRRRAAAAPPPPGPRLQAAVRAPPGPCRPRPLTAAPVASWRPRPARQWRAPSLPTAGQ